MPQSLRRLAPLSGIVFAALLVVTFSSPSTPGRPRPAEAGMRTLSIAALQTAPVARDPEATLERLAERARQSGLRSRTPSCSSSPSSIWRPSPGCWMRARATPSRSRCVYRAR